MTLSSRQGKELTPVLPDLAAALGAQVPPGVVLDGEAVIWNRDRLDFEALQRRMVTSRAALPALVKEFPAGFAAFDVLAVAGQDVRGVPFAGRRQLLVELAREWAAPLALSPTTTDPELAKSWLRDLPATGIEGLVINSLLNERDERIKREPCDAGTTCPASVVGRWVEGVRDDVGIGRSELIAVGKINTLKSIGLMVSCCDMRGCTDGDRPASQ